MRLTVSLTLIALLILMQPTSSPAASYAMGRKDRAVFKLQSGYGAECFNQGRNRVVCESYRHSNGKTVTRTLLTSRSAAGQFPQLDLAGGIDVWAGAFIMRLSLAKVLCSVASDFSFVGSCTTE